MKKPSIVALILFYCFIQIACQQDHPLEEFKGRFNFTSELLNGQETIITSPDNVSTNIKSWYGMYNEIEPGLEDTLYHLELDLVFRKLLYYDTVYCWTLTHGEYNIQSKKDLFNKITFNPAYAGSEFSRESIIYIAITLGENGEVNYYPTDYYAGFENKILLRREFKIERNPEIDFEKRERENKKRMSDFFNLKGEVVDRSFKDDIKKNKIVFQENK